MKTFEDLVRITAEAKDANVNANSVLAAYGTNASAASAYAAFAASPILDLGIYDPVTLVHVGFMAGLLVAHSVPEPGPLTPQESTDDHA